MTLRSLEAFVGRLASGALESLSLLSTGGNELHVGRYRNEPVFDVEHLGEVNHRLVNPHAPGVDRHMVFVGGQSREVSDRYLIDFESMRSAVTAFGVDGSMEPSLHWLELKADRGPAPWMGGE